MVIGDGVTVPHGVGVSSADPAPVAAIAGSDRRRFICRGCYFIYEEAEGLPQAGIKPSTSFAALPLEWRCPDCGTEKDKPYVALTSGAT